MNGARWNNQRLEARPRISGETNNVDLKSAWPELPKMSESWRRRIAWMLMLPTAASGMNCSQPKSKIGAIPVKGVVKFHGEPVREAVVTFVPRGADGRSAVGLTDTYGRFRLGTASVGDGARPATYDVTVAKSVTTSETMILDEAEREKYYREHGKLPEVEVKQLLPEKYLLSETSGLSATVEAGKSNAFSFDLTE